MCISGCSHKSRLHCSIRSHTDEGLAVLKLRHVRQTVATLVVKILSQGPSLNNLNHTWRPLGGIKSFYEKDNWCSDPRSDFRAHGLRFTVGAGEYLAQMSFPTLLFKQLCGFVYENPSCCLLGELGSGKISLTGFCLPGLYIWPM